MSDQARDLQSSVGNNVTTLSLPLAAGASAAPILEGSTSGSMPAAAFNYSSPSYQPSSSHQSDAQTSGESGKKWAGAHQCYYCDSPLKRRSLLIQHQEQQHSGEKPFECTVCNRKFAKRSTLCRHKVVHNDERRFGCEQCGATYKRKDYLATHCKTLHRDTMLSGGGDRPSDTRSDQQNFSIVTPGPTNEQHHVGRHCGETVKVHKCYYCDRPFTRLSLLMQHQKQQHRGEKPFECTVCNSKFTKLYMLRRHNLGHNNERPFGCEQCGARFKMKGAAARHCKRKRIDTMLRGGGDCPRDTSSDQQSFAIGMQGPTNKEHHVSRHCGEASAHLQRITSGSTMNRSDEEFVGSRCVEVPARLFTPTRREEPCTVVPAPQCKTCRERLSGLQVMIPEHTLTGKRRHYCDMCGQRLEEISSDQVVDNEKEEDGDETFFLVNVDYNDDEEARKTI